MIKRPNSKTDSRTCNLCGLPLRYGKVTAVFSGDPYAFCCNGCRQVFTILMESTDSPNPETFRETDLFKECLAKGIIPSSEEELTGAEAQFDVERFIPPNIPLQKALEEIEERLVRRALTQCNNVQAHAAKSLAITKSLIQHKMKKYNISV